MNMENSKECKKINHKNINIEKLFIDFLKKEGIYQKWKFNVSKQSGHPLNIKNFKKNTFHPDNKGKEAINYSFIWNDTDEGQSFWAYYDAKWKRLYFNGSNILCRYDADCHNRDWREVEPLFEII